MSGQRARAQRRGLPDYSLALREARQATGLTGDELARRLLVSASAYRNAENGRGGPGVFNADLQAVFPVDVAEQLRALWDAADEATNGHARFDQTELLLPLPLIEGLAQARVTRFYPSRRYYSLLRDGRGSMREYVTTAVQSLEMVSIALATGVDLEGIVATFEQMLSRPQPPKITVSLLDPEIPALAEAIGPVVQSSPDVLRGRTRDAIDELRKMRDRRVARSRQSLFEVWCHNCVPNASAIILDGDADSGLVQLETKGYKTGMDASFGFEVGAPSEFFLTLRDSYRSLIADGRQVV